MDDDAVVGRITAVFEQARSLARERGEYVRNPELEMPAMELLMDYALQLEAAGLVDVAAALAATTDKPITEAQMRAAIDRHLGARHSQ